MEIKNEDLPKLIDFLNIMQLKGKASLGRTKLKEVLVEKHALFSEDQMMIIDEYDGWKNKDEGTYDMDNLEMIDTMIELGKSKISFSYETPFSEDFIKEINDYNVEMTGVDADAYSILYSMLVL